MCRWCAYVLEQKHSLKEIMHSMRPNAQHFPRGEGGGVRQMEGASDTERGERMGGETQRKRGERGGVAGERERLRDRGGGCCFHFLLQRWQNTIVPNQLHRFLNFSSPVSRVEKGGGGRRELGRRRGDGGSKPNEQDGRIPNATMFALHVTTMRQRTALDESDN